MLTPTSEPLLMKSLFTALSNFCEFQPKCNKIETVKCTLNEVETERIDDDEFQSRKDGEKSKQRERCESKETRNEHNTTKCIANKISRTSNFVIFIALHIRYDFRFLPVYLCQ